MASQATLKDGKRYSMTIKMIKKKKAGITILVSDKTDFKTKPAMTDNNKGIKPTRGYNICNIYVSNIGAYKYIN